MQCHHIRHGLFACLLDIELDKKSKKWSRLHCSPENGESKAPVVCECLNRGALWVTAQNTHIAMKEAPTLTTVLQEILDDLEFFIHTCIARHHSSRLFS